MVIKLGKLKISFDVIHHKSMYIKHFSFSLHINYTTKAYERYLAKQREDALFKFTIRQIAKSTKQDIRAKGDITIGN